MQKLKITKKNVILNMYVLVALSIFISIVILALVVSIVRGSKTHPVKKPLAAATLDNSRMTVGGFTITYYCPNSCCNDLWAGKVSDGHTMEYYIKKGESIVAVDPKVIPLGSTVYWNNTRYMCRDIGKSVKGKKLDILVPTHSDTLKYGTKKNQTIIIEMSS